MCDPLRGSPATQGDEDQTSVGKLKTIADAEVECSRTGGDRIRTCPQRCGQRGPSQAWTAAAELVDTSMHAAEPVRAQQVVGPIDAETLDELTACDKTLLFGQQLDGVV